jgi:hypothetical protein
MDSEALLMLSLDAPRKFLAKLAPMSAAAWHALGTTTFPGELSIATDNSVYRLNNGVFLGRVQKGGRTFDSPPAMRSTRLVGFLHDEGGLWSLSPRWRPGSHAVLWKPGAIGEESFVLTSPVVELTREEPEPRPSPTGPAPSPWAMQGLTPSGVRLRRVAPPSLRHLAAASTTRIHSAAPVAVER